MSLLSFTLDVTPTLNAMRRSRALRALWTLAGWAMIGALWAGALALVVLFMAGGPGA